MTTRLITIMACLLSASAWGAAPSTDEFLSSGRFDEGIAALESHLAQQPRDDTARFGLGTIRFVRSIQQVGQKLAVYGVQMYDDPELGQVFGEVFGDPPAPDQPLTYPRLRKILQEWLDDLAGVEAALAGIQSDDVKLVLHVGRVPLKFGPQTRPVNLEPLLREMLTLTDQEAPEFTVAFDRADVDWLRGYCHLLSAFGEIGLAYDGQEWFDVIIHRLLKHVKPRYEFLVEDARAIEGVNREEWNRESAIESIKFITDLIASFHVIRFPVVEPDRLKSALKHLEATLSHSRTTWTHVLAETDDEHEWIPNPRQKGVLNVDIKQSMIDQWMVALGEAEQIVQGKKLLPFWRGRPGRGINVRRVFLEPSPLDLVLWLQGTAAAPYLEEGELTSPDTWQQINAAFGGEFPGFVLWFN